MDVKNEREESDLNQSASKASTGNSSENPEDSQIADFDPNAADETAAFDAFIPEEELPDEEAFFGEDALEFHDDADAEADFSGGAVPPPEDGRVPARNSEPPASKWETSRVWLIIGLLLSAVMAGAGVYFSLDLQSLNLLPLKFLVPIMVVLWLILALVFFLQFVRKARIVAKILPIVFSALLIYGISLVDTTSSFLSAGSDVTVNVDTMAVYVLTDDPAETMDDAKDYSFGILETLGRTNTDQTIACIESEWDCSLSTTEYVSMIELAQALLDGEVQAILVNSAYLSVLDEDDELEDFEEGIRLLLSYDIERVLEIASTLESEEEEEVEEEEIAEEVEETEETEEVEETLEPFVVYISGNDDTDELASAGRSDVNILAAVNPYTDTILLVSTPRDFYVELAGIGEYDKLTHAGVYGVDVSLNTLANLYDVSIQYYFRLNFSGFIRIINALGGITVESEYDFETRTGYVFVKGENELDGKAALAFVRDRYSFASGDRQRGKNQMAVIKAVIDKISSPAILTGYLDIMNAASGCFETNMTSDEIAELVRYQLAYGIDWEIESISANGSDGYSTVYSAQSTSVYVMYPDEELVDEISEALNAFLEAETKEEVAEALKAFEDDEEEESEDEDASDDTDAAED